MSRIRVVFSIGALHGGGSERQIVSALTHLNRDRFEPHLYVVYRSGPLLSLVPDDVKIAAFEERDRRPPTRIPGGMHRRRVDDMRRYLREVKADLSYDRTFLMTLVSAEAAQQVGISNISTIVTDPATGFEPVAGRFQWFKKRSLRRLYGRSTNVLAVSTGAARSAEHFYRLAPNSVESQYNGVDIAAIRSAAKNSVDSPWWNAKSVEGKTLVRLVSAGRLNYEKGFHLLIDAVAELQSTNSAVQFRLALLGEGDHRSQLQNQIDAAGLTEQVRMPGFQDNTAAWYGSADAFVLASLVEGMPNVLLEAMACGTPVLSSRCPHGPHEILEDGRYGILCDTNSVAALVDGVQSIVHHPAIANERAAEAKTQVESVFSQQVAISKLEEIFTAAVQRKN